MIEKPEPDSPSEAYKVMEPYWTKVNSILAGQDAILSAGAAYLPLFSEETGEEYQFRLQCARFTNIFGDIVDTLSAKPFTKELTVNGGGSDIEALIEDIDGMGNHIHVFAGGLFHSAIANAIEWIFIDYTRLAIVPKTVAEQKAAGGRPYWVRIPAQRVKAVYSEVIAGKETLVHVRIEEEASVRIGFEEKCVERVRVLNREVITNEMGEAIAAGPATWELWEEQERTSKDTRKPEWVRIVDPQPITIGIIPMVPVIMGRREGASWVIAPPLKSAADLQITHYRQESALEYAKIMAAFPMLAGNGVAQPFDDNNKAIRIPVGPKTVLFAPPNGEGQHGEWTFIEPNATSLRFLADEIDGTEQQLRELGRQPLTAKAGNITTITAAYAGDKAHSVIEAWALNLKDALEQALKITAMWLGSTEDKIEVNINTDFMLDMQDGKDVTALTDARKNGDLSRETFWAEMQRRGILSPNFDPAVEATNIENEMPGDPSPQEIAAAQAAMPATA